MRPQIAIASLIRVATSLAPPESSCSARLYLTDAAEAEFGPEISKTERASTRRATYASFEANPEQSFTQAADTRRGGSRSSYETQRQQHRRRVGQAHSRRRPAGARRQPRGAAAEAKRCEQFQSDPKGCPAGSEAGTTEMEAVADRSPARPSRSPNSKGPSTTSSPRPGCRSTSGSRSNPSAN